MGTQEQTSLVSYERGDTQPSNTALPPPGNAQIDEDKCTQLGTLHKRTTIMILQVKT